MTDPIATLRRYIPNLPTPAARGFVTEAVDALEAELTALRTDIATYVEMATDHTTADRVKAPAEKPDFPPWSAAMAELVREMWNIRSELAHNGLQRARVKALADAAFPETPDAG